MKNVTKTAIENSLPDAIGAFVEWLLHESGWKVTERFEADGSREARPDRSASRLPSLPPLRQLLRRRHHARLHQGPRGAQHSVTAGGRQIVSRPRGSRDHARRSHGHRVARRSALGLRDAPRFASSRSATPRCSSTAIATDASIRSALPKELLPDRPARRSARRCRCSRRCTADATTVPSPRPSLCFSKRRVPTPASRCGPPESRCWPMCSTSASWRRPMRAAAGSRSAPSSISSARRRRAHGQPKHPSSKKAATASAS